MKGKAAVHCANWTGGGENVSASCERLQHGCARELKGQDLRRTEADPLDGPWQRPNASCQVAHDVDDLAPRAGCAAELGPLVLVLRAAGHGDRDDQGHAAEYCQLAELAGADPAQERRLVEVERAGEVGAHVGDVDVARQVGVGRRLLPSRCEVEDESLWNSSVSAELAERNEMRERCERERTRMLACTALKAATST